MAGPYDGGWNGAFSNSYHGTVFGLSLDGTLKTVLSFSGYGGPYPGAGPYAGLTLGSDGNLYGTTGYGSHGAGNVFRIVMPGPQLTINRQPSTINQLVLSWRTNYTGFKLQTSSALTGANWIDAANSPVAVGGQFFITNSMSGNAQFFRLKR